MLHAFISSAFSPSCDPEKKYGTVGWAFALARTCEHPDAIESGYILEATASGRYLGVSGHEGAHHALRMASRMASTDTDDSQDAACETMAVHGSPKLIDALLAAIAKEDAKSRRKAKPVTGSTDWFGDGIFLCQGRYGTYDPESDGPYKRAWPHGTGIQELADNLAMKASNKQDCAYD